MISYIQDIAIPSKQLQEHVIVEKFTISPFLHLFFGRWNVCRWPTIMSMVGLDGTLPLMTSCSSPSPSSTGGGANG